MANISIENKEKLSDLYYKDSNYFGRDKLYTLAQSKDINVSRRQVMTWLKDQEIYQRYKKADKAKTIKPTILKEPFKQLGIDLIDMQGKEYKQNRYILTCIDLFSKYAWAEPIKTKTDTDVSNALNKIIKSIPSQVSSIRSDRGPEFVNDKMKKLLDTNNIKQVLSMPYKPQSNGNIERFNGIIKKMINMALKYNDSYDWVTIMPQLLKNYNDSKHSTQITKDDFKDVHENIKKSVTPNIDTSQTHLLVGDRVRIKQTNEKDGTQWSKQIYTISKVYKPRKSVSLPYYLIDGFDKHYYANDIQQINNVENQFNENELFEISKLVAPSFKNGEPSFVVKWKGYKEPTVERKSKLMEDVPKLVKKFEKDHNVVWKKKSFNWN